MPDEVDRTATIELHRAWLDQIRATDEISLKLLALVPTISGIIIAILVPKGSELQLGAPQTIAIGLFGAWVSFFIYRWEKRNIETCEWYRERIAEIERRHFDICSAVGGGLASFPAHPTLFKNRFPIGKRRAEFWMYTGVVIAWILLAIYGVVAAWQ